MDNKEEKPKTEKKGKYVVKDGEGNIISQNMPKEFEDMIDLISKKQRKRAKSKKKWSITLHITNDIKRCRNISFSFYYPI